MTWPTFHRRGEVLRAVVTAAQTRRDGVLPLDVPGVAAVFDDERDLLGALQLSWYTRLAGRIDRHEMAQPASLEDAVIAAWRDVFAEFGGVRRVLDTARDSDDDRVRWVMDRATGKEHQLLAVAAGLASGGDPAAARVGARLEERARQDAPAREPHPSGPTRVWDRVVDRIRSLAA